MPINPLPWTKQHDLKVFFMDKNLGHAAEQIKAIFDFDIVRRLFFLAGIAISVAVGFSVYQWTKDPIYRPLDFRANDQNYASIIDALEKGNIPYKLNEANGVISVPATDINRAKRELSSAGIQKEEGFNFSFLNDKNKLGSSQFLENARYIHALEADIAKTIASIQGISSAKVNIAKPQNNIFADENSKTTASIIVNVKPGYEADKEKVRSIIQLVSASVPELDPTNVAITDQYGHYLSSMTSEDYIFNQEQLNYQHTIENNYQKRIQSLILPMLGENKASINVNAEMDFTQQEESKEEYDPAQTAIRSEQSVKDGTSSASGAGVPGALTNQPPAADSSAKPADSGQSVGQSRTEEVKNYEVTKSTTYVKKDHVKIKNISVAIVLDNDLVYDEKTKKNVSKALDKKKLDNITELVKSAIGFNETRGDRVTVINSSFIQPTMEEEIKTHIWDEPWFWDLVKKLSGIIFGFLFLIVIYRKIAPDFIHAKAKKNEPPMGLANQSAGISITPEMIQLKNEQIEILKQLVSKDPNKVSGVIKKWVAK